MPLKPSHDLALIARVLREAKPLRWHVVAVFVLGVAATPLGLLAPLPLKVAVDSVLGTKPLPKFLSAVVPETLSDSSGGRLIVAASLVVLIALLAQVQWASAWMLGTYTGERLVLSFRAKLFQHVQRLSLAYHDSRGSTDATYRVQYDAPAIQWILLDGLVPMVSSALKLVGMIVVMLLLDPVIALIALGVAPILFVLTRYYRLRVRDQWREVKQLESSAMSVVQEVIGSLRVVKAFGQEEREHSRFLQHSSKGMGARLRAILWESIFGLLVGLTAATGTAIVLYVGVSHVRSGMLTLGELLVVMAYLSQFYEPLKSLSKNVTSLQKSFASAERTFGLLDETPDVVERPDALPLSRARGRIECHDVSFAYDGVNLVLQHVSFEIRPGARVGIFGPTGAGKSTLINLLTRFYDPTSGAVALDGIDFRDIRLVDLRSQFAIVLQEPLLLSATIAENIAYARPEAHESDIIAAAKAANAHDFITQMPDGYRTLVGERGLRLSGGERQRISLARAFLKDAPILILDEPTSSVDGRTEAGIIDAMNRLMEGRTTIMIAHRLSTLRHCDMLLRITHGAVTVESGDVAATLAKEELGRSPSFEATGALGGVR